MTDCQCVDNHDGACVIRRDSIVNTNTITNTITTTDTIITTKDVDHYRTYLIVGLDTVGCTSETVAHALDKFDKDFEGAKKLLLQAIEDNNESADNKAFAMYELAYVYTQLKDRESAFEWYKKVADQNYSFAFYQVGYRYYYGSGVDKNYNKAKEWFEKSVLQARNPQASYFLGYMYENGKGCTADPVMAYESYMNATKLGNLNGMWSIGHCYEEGISVAQNYNMARNWYTKAADLGSSRAIWKLGEFYEKGYGCTKDLVAAIEKYQQAADKGSYEAQNRLGECYENGIGVSKSPNKAFELYKKAANSYIPAIKNLARCYQNGIGCNVDMDEAERILEKIKTLE